MRLDTYLTFNGQCEAAFKFYEKCLGGKIETMMTHGESPMAKQVSPEWRNKIMHAHMTVGSTVLMGSDTPPEHCKAPQGFSLSIGVKEVAEGERIFKELEQGGKVQMPLQKTFWAAGFGMVVDRFGIPWMVNCEQAGAAAGDD